MAKTKRSNSKAAAKKEALDRIKQGAKDGTLTEREESKINQVSPLGLVLLVLAFVAAYFLAEYLKTLG